MAEKTKTAAKPVSKAQLLFESISVQYGLIHDLFILVEKQARGEHVPHTTLRAYRERLGAFEEFITDVQKAS